MFKIECVVVIAVVGGGGVVVLDDGDCVVTIYTIEPSLHFYVSKINSLHHR